VDFLAHLDALRAYILSFAVTNNGNFKLGFDNKPQMIVTDKSSAMLSNNGTVIMPLVY